MRYFSKSPEEWRKHEKEFLDKEKEKTRRSRKQGLYFLMLNLFVLFIFFIGLRLYYGQLPSGNSAINQILIQIEEPYVPGDLLDVKVRLYNNHNKERTVEVKNFNFQIFKGEKLVYSFSYPHTVKTELTAFTSRLLFDLKREVEITALEAGEYKVVVTVQIDDELVQAQKTFTVIENYQVFLDGLLDFYLPFEDVSFSAHLVNNTARTADINVEKVRYSLKKGDITIFEREIPLNLRFEKVEIGRDVKILDSEQIKLSETGKYLLNFQCFVNGSISSTAVPVFCVSSLETNLKNVGLYSDAPREITAKDQINFSIFVQNQTNKDVFLPLDEIVIRLEPSTLLARLQSVRLWLSPYENYEIFKFSPLNAYLFNQPGFYKIVTQIRLGQETKTLETFIRVLQ
ncbi:hypothetical protein [Pseudothermotoga thermarum]|uniref:Uncharacterized protein n=1 Tax=Pseudothermotoga thermarum DSM 5069 TaxID=688269 RepID=F7YUA2_9THEM|nr:hypothetical protein [Pseudothermotoga thermarum]AEH51301.1 hypothetical protein Theth_1229 [Pseudothermotoga thermarum DSM 5069]